MQFNPECKKLVSVGHKHVQNEKILGKITPQKVRKYPAKVRKYPQKYASQDF